LVIKAEKSREAAAKKGDKKCNKKCQTKFSGFIIEVRAKQVHPALCWTCVPA